MQSKSDIKYNQHQHSKGLSLVGFTLLLPVLLLILSVMVCLRLLFTQIALPTPLAGALLIAATIW